MAFPVILVNSATGSDSAASGAGPATALTGSAASTSGTGLVVTLDGSPDLSGVATDGSHVIYLADATGANRNFSKITAKDDGAKTVTVANAFGLSISGKSWAIGGKRASSCLGNSWKILTRDALPGWTIEIASGHTETVGGAISFSVAGDQTSGPITIRGEAGASVLPIITLSVNSTLFSIGSGNWHIEDIEFRNTNATKTTSIAISIANAHYVVVKNVKIDNSTDKFAYGIKLSGSKASTVRDCDIGYCAISGIYLAGTTDLTIRNCWIYNCTSDGILGSDGSDAGYTLIDSIISNNGGDGLHSSLTAGTTTKSTRIISNTFAGNTGDGIEFTHLYGTIGLAIINNIFATNGGYGVNFSNGSFLPTNLTGYGCQILNNNFYNNTSGKYFPTTITNSENETTADPGFTNAAGGDYSIGTNLKATGFPLGGTLPVGRSPTYSYVDPGAAQRQEAGGSAGVMITGGMVGGMRS